MNTHSLTLAPDHVVMSELRTAAAKSNESTAQLLELIAEVDARALYVAEGYSSMYLFCVHDLHMSEDTAYKRIQVARAARRFPAIIPAIAQGRLHLTAVVMLAPHLTAENAEGLLAAATHSTKAGISAVLARHCPRPDVPAGIRDVLGAPMTDQLVPEPVAACSLPSAPGPVASPAPRPGVTPTSPGRFAVQFMLDEAAHDELRYARSLVG
ncbi:MAG: hypothetical protein ABIU54_09235, partial [Candidatus Eisenbacteria bacterium]